MGDNATYVVSQSNDTKMVSEDKTTYIKSSVVEASIVSEHSTTRIESSTCVVIPPDVVPTERVTTYVEAAENIAGYRVVTTDQDGRLIYMDPTNYIHRHRILGVTTDYIGSGTIGSVLVSGEISDAGWSWDVFRPIFLGGQGTIIQIPPISGFVVVIAFAISPTVIFVRNGGYTLSPITATVMLGEDDILNGYIDLQYHPVSPYEDNVMVEVVPGVLQIYYKDYAVIEDNEGIRRRITWNPNYIEVSEGLYGSLSVGDLIRTTYMCMF
ncbi:MAG: hypothetical protein GY861_22630 [bacterium]|nr:hypothetical protein [bacterium]